MVMAPNWLQGFSDYMGGEQAGQGSEGMQGMLGNPMFQMGQGLMQHRADRNYSIPQAILGGYGSAQQEQESAEERERTEKLRAELEEYFSQQDTSEPIASDPFSSPEMAAYIAALQGGGY